MRGSALLVLIAGSIVIGLSTGLRQVAGLFLRPVTMDLDLTREQFGIAVAIHNVVWGLAQPVAGLLADRYGARPVALGAGLLYAAGLGLASVATGPVLFALGFGVLLGFGLSGTAYAVVLGAISRSVPPGDRSVAIGIASTAGSLGMFVLVPSTEAVLGLTDWRGTMLLLALLAGTMPLLALLLRERREVADPGRPALRVPAGVVARVAGGDRSFWLLNFGFATCGFQLAFVATYVPAIIADAGLSPALGAGVLAAIGACNILGTYLAGLAGARWRKKYVLSWLYVARAVVFLAFVMWPVGPVSALLFGAAMGLMWTGTVPLTSGLTGDLYGHRNLGFLFGLVYVGHQMGAFLGAWAGGFAFDRTGSFDIVWALCIGLSLLAALLHAVLDDAPRPLALAEAAG